MVNKVILVGNVGADPEIKQVNDSKVAKFSIATTESYKNKQGERVSNTEWHNISMWRGLAEVVEKYVKKGSQIYIEGKLTYRSYERDGETKYFTEIVANEMKLLGSKPSGNNNNQPNASESGEKDDLPF